MGEGDDALNPAQREVLAQLGAGGGPDGWPAYTDELRHELRRALEEGLAPTAEAYTADRPLRVTKHLLASVHGCEARFVVEQGQGFTPSVAVLRGTIVHKALELAVHWSDNPLPLVLVDAAIERVADADHWAADHLRTLDEVDRAELRSAAGDVVAKFQECWPPLTPNMRPSTEAACRAVLCDGRIQVNGRVDLSLGQAVGSGNHARKVIVDLKTGGPAPAHREDLRLYALVETLRVGVPPRLLVSAYLDQGRNEAEAVTEDLLWSAARRTVDGVRRLAVLLADGADPEETVLRPSGACRWCPLLDGCATGRAFLADRDA